MEKPLVYLSQHRKLHVASRHHLRNLPRLGQRSQRTHALGAVLAARYNSTEAMGAADQTLQVSSLRAHFILHHKNRAIIYFAGLKIHILFFKEDHNMLRVQP